MKSKSLVGGTTVLGVVVLLLLALSACGESGAGSDVSQQEAADVFSAAFTPVASGFGVLMTGDLPSGPQETMPGCVIIWDTEEIDGGYSVEWNFDCTVDGTTLVGTASGTYRESGDPVVYELSLQADLVVTGNVSATMSFELALQYSEEEYYFSGNITINGEVFSFEELYAGA
jgi:hypothetical protein